MVVEEKPAESQPEVRVRWANVERLRILAMFEIIGFHSASERLILLGGIGLPIFLILTNLFNCTVSDRRGFRQFARDKFSRLFYPWLFWCAVYGVAHAAFAMRRDVPLSKVFDPLMLLYGTNLHLWFVPFALVSGVSVAYVQSLTRKQSHGRMIFLSASAGAVLLLATAYVHTLRGFPAPFSQYIYAASSPFIGFAMGRTLLVNPEKRFAAFSVLCIAGAVFVPIALALPIKLFAVRFAVAAVFVGLALMWPGTSDWLTKKLAPLLLGIYLIHPLLIRFTKRGAVVDDYIVLYIFAVFLLSALAIFFMRKTPLKRFT
ncbi:MAG: acyltransferase [Candidatus Hydrogenedentes bacterium]|nr:acyltransferase [Candidatus Hydrogenedentota bacterium]